MRNFKWIRASSASLNPSILVSVSAYVRGKRLEGRLAVIPDFWHRSVDICSLICALYRKEIGSKQLHIRFFCAIIWWIWFSECTTLDSRVSMRRAKAHCHGRLVFDKGNDSFQLLIRVSITILPVGSPCILCLIFAPRYTLVSKRGSNAMNTQFGLFYPPSWCHHLKYNASNDTFSRQCLLIDNCWKNVP